MIETDRLIIKPLTPGQLQKYIRTDNSLAEELNLIPVQRIISRELKEALEESIIPGASDPGRNYLYYTLWTLISKEENKMVGDLCFTGEPDINGSVEIGYGIYDEFRKRGYMTEAVRAMIYWAKDQPGIKSVLASTEKDNTGSSSILLRNGFIKCGETETLFNWRYDIKIEGNINN